MMSKVEKSVGKAQRSETVTVRLDPEVRYLAEIASRSQRRTLSSFIEWAVTESFAHVDIVPFERFEKLSATVAEMRSALWDPIESDRLCILGSLFPHLMSLEEQKVFKLIVELQYHSPLASNVGGENKGFGMPIEQLERVRKYWELLKTAAKNETPPRVVADMIKRIEASANP